MTINLNEVNFSDISLNSEECGIKISKGMMEIKDLAPNLSGDDGWPMTINLKWVKGIQVADLIGLGLVTLARKPVTFNSQTGEEKSHPSAMAKVKGMFDRFRKHGIRSRQGREGFDERDTKAREIMLDSLEKSYPKPVDLPNYSEIKSKIGTGKGKTSAHVLSRNAMWHDESRREKARKMADDYFESIANPLF